MICVCFPVEIVFFPFHLMSKHFMAFFRAWLCSAVALFYSSYLVKDNVKAYRTKFFSAFFLLLSISQYRITAYNLRFALYELKHNTNTVLWTLQ